MNNQLLIKFKLKKESIGGIIRDGWSRRNTEAP